MGKHSAAVHDPLIAAAPGFVIGVVAFLVLSIALRDFKAGIVAVSWLYIGNETGKAFRKLANDIAFVAVVENANDA